MQAKTRPRNSHPPTDGLLDGEQPRSRETNGYATVPISWPASASPPSSFSPTGANFIEHRVSKMDTLAGVAIKYGVEVGDIRRMNGLVTDLQMFAHKSLQIPLPGRHPTSPAMANGSTKSCHIVDPLQSFKVKPSSGRISPAMCSLQDYYGLPKSNRTRHSSEGTEMSVYKLSRTPPLEEEEDDRLVLELPASSDPLHSQHQKVSSLVNGFSPEKCDHSEDMNELEQSIRRRPRADDDPSLHTPEFLLREESSVGVFTGRAGKGLALRPKPGSRTELEEGRRQNSVSSCDSPATGDAFLSVRKSSSASNLSESESSSSSIWQTSKWSLKPDVIARPIFDGLPNPIASWRSKAALD
ncbi:F-box protein [Platanthera zijinensis]|uniref:F-box protein n=1 Tax=Platanthera zijinensis TaxID=2320716 RepID=A0AAP0BV60_9ASPA